MIQVVTLTTDPVDLFEAAGLGTGGFGTARTPGMTYRAQNIGQETVRYASAAAQPTDLSAGFRLSAGSEKDLTVKNEPTWAWVASGTGRVAMEV